jgi:hypothetical protein
VFDLWLRSGAFGVIAIPFILLYGIAAGIVWLTHKSPLRPFFASCVGIPGPFFTSIAVLFALFAAFLSNDVQRRANDAQGAIMREADGVRTMLRLTETLGEDGTPMTMAAVGYAREVLSKELPKMRNGMDVTNDLEPLRALSASVMSFFLASSVTPATQNAILDALIDVRRARTDRVTLADRASTPLNWVAMLVLGILTQFAVAVVQLDKIRPQALALFVFTTSSDRPRRAAVFRSSYRRHTVARCGRLGQQVTSWPSAADWLRTGTGGVLDAIRNVLCGWLPHCRD